MKDRPTSTEEARRLIDIASDRGSGDGDLSFLEEEELAADGTLDIEAVIIKITEATQVLTEVAQAEGTTEDDISDLLDQLPDLMNAHDLVYASVGLTPPGSEEEEEEEEEEEPAEDEETED